MQTPQGVSAPPHGTHNAGVEGSDEAVASYRATAGGGNTTVQNAPHALTAGTQVGQRSSTVEHPTHNGEVAGAAPAAGIAVAALVAVAWWVAGPGPEPRAWAPKCVTITRHVPQGYTLVARAPVTVCPDSLGRLP